MQKGKLFMLQIQAYNQATMTYFPKIAIPIVQQHWKKAGLHLYPEKIFLDTLNQSKVLSSRLLKTLSHAFAVLAKSIGMFAQRSFARMIGATTTRSLAEI